MHNMMPLCFFLCPALPGTQIATRTLHYLGHVKLHAACARVCVCGLDLCACLGCPCLVCSNCSQDVPVKCYAGHCASDAHTTLAAAGVSQGVESKLFFTAPFKACKWPLQEDLTRYTSEHPHAQQSKLLIPLGCLLACTLVDVPLPSPPPCRSGSTLA